ncbi:MAG: hypothetical protein E7013_03940 [Alphaproteobacteria bacterium]|nr:hypothetical protein [Alphaproteobacteria bacterium]
MYKNDSYQTQIERHPILQRLGCSAVKTETTHPLPKRKRVLRRKKFHRSIQKVFVKYLYLVDSQSIRKFFNQKEILALQLGELPSNWTVHHQKSIFWGGTNFNPKFEQQIYQTPLTKTQENKCKKQQNAEELKLRFQLENFLQNALKKGHLKRTFLELFKGYLIALPIDIHRKLEDDYLKPQEAQATQDEETNPSNTFKYEISYPIWNQLIYHGQDFSKKKPPQTIGKHKIKDTQEKNKKKGHSKADD